MLLMDQTEQLSVTSASELCSRLGCDPAAVGKVVSILGNTGEGKSHTLNQTFFCGEDVFQTSSQQTSCTSGVWAAFDPSLQALILDTEGMLGTSDNENVRTRMLLKVLAVSDIVIYRSRAERLHNDLFYFLGDASRAYNQHFQVLYCTVLYCTMLYGTEGGGHGRKSKYTVLPRGGRVQFDF